MTEAFVLRDDLTNEFNEIGVAMTVTRGTPGAYDPTTGAVGAPTSVDYSGVGRLGSYSDMEIDGTLIKANDRKATFVSLDTTFVPQISDRLTVGTDVYSVVSLKPRELGGEYICFTLQVRR
jgi:hypothetical protein